MSEAAAPAQAVQQKSPKKPLPELTGPQKAAAVIIALGAEKASNLYKYMDPEDVEQLTLEVARLGYLNAEQTEDVLTEFTQMCMTNKAVTEGGLEYARSVLEKAYGEQAADDLLNKVTRTLKNRESAFMNKADVKSLYSALQNERPQTIALVLSYVEAEKAAGVVAQLEAVSYTHLTKQNAQLGQEAAYQATATYAQQGQLLLKAQVGEELVTQFAQDAMNKDLKTNVGIQFLPTVGPEITCDPGEMNIRFEMDKLNFDWRQSKGNFEFVPGDIEISVKQRPDVIIKYIGGPIYVPPSSDPDYEPVDVHA